MPDLFGKQQNDTTQKKSNGDKRMVVSAEAMPQGIGPDDQGEDDHGIFKTSIIDDFHPEQWERRK